MTALEVLRLTWRWEPSVALGCAALGAGYLVATRMRPGRAGAWFLFGVLVLWLALDSPLDTLGDTYLFSAHMAQHLLLLLVVPPLLLLGIPPSPARAAWEARPLVRGAVRTAGHPLAAWGLGVGTMWLWHAPALYNAALADGRVHVVEHLAFLATSVVFWWPVLGQPAQARMSAPPALLYLLAAALATTGLGVLLTFTPPGLYPAYLLPADRLGLLPLLRRSWGMTPDVDQQVGGLLMWIPGGLVYLSAIVGVLLRWYGEPEQAEEVATAS
jgi:putative membrane protein